MTRGDSLPRQRPEIEGRDDVLVKPSDLHPRPPAVLTDRHLVHARVYHRLAQLVFRLGPLKVLAERPADIGADLVEAQDDVLPASRLCGFGDLVREPLAVGPTGAHYLALAVRCRRLLAVLDGAVVLEELVCPSPDDREPLFGQPAIRVGARCS